MVIFGDPSLLAGSNPSPQETAWCWNEIAIYCSLAVLKRAFNLYFFLYYIVLCFLWTTGIIVCRFLQVLHLNLTTACNNLACI